MVLIVGSTGLLGEEVCRRALAAGHPVRALVRASSNPEKRAALESAGATAVIGDLKAPDRLAAALEGVDALITTASCTFSRQEGDAIETVDRQGHLNLIEAARSAGVRRFVYVSIPPDLRDDCPLFRAKREVEDALAHSGMEYSILLANYFMEVWLSPMLGFDYPNRRATVYGSGEEPLAWISYRDVAGFAVDALGCPEARNRALLVGGPENLSPHDVIDAFERTARGTFAVEHVPWQDLRQRYTEAADPLGRSFAALMLAYARGCPMDIRDTLAIMPRRLTTIADYAAAVCRPRASTAAQ